MRLPRPLVAALLAGPMLFWAASPAPATPAPASQGAVCTGTTALFALNPSPCTVNCTVTIVGPVLISSLPGCSGCATRATATQDCGGQSVTETIVLQTSCGGQVNQLFHCIDPIPVGTQPTAFAQFSLRCDPCDE